MKNTDLYLLAQYAMKPRDTSQTKVSGYMQDPANVTYDEMVEISKSLRDADRIKNNVILNLTTKQVVKNSFNATATFDEMIKYYCDAYPSYLAQLGFTLEETNAPSDVQSVQEQSQEAA
ncbi:hypothetical protein UFOVP116_382 [uncultured Caudovirales phage]|uniref:Uncharacterized protein n=1 Tax=uncultured Caudovirales phage TaxID=2100421 RepID=A0A6J5L8I7_9CAUD|nr:hypothetical protein UFOVP116_382 [uncultured Caudovirales phage]